MSEHLNWLRACAQDPTSPGHGLPSLGMLTGQDGRALAAIDACWQLYAASDRDGQRAALDSIAFLLEAMQPQCWPFARELIARSLDWHDREPLWSDVLQRLEITRAAQATARGLIRGFSE